MIQIYFLSVFFSGLAGYALVVDDPDTRSGFPFKGEKPRLWLGVCAMVAGVLKLLSSINGDIPVLGDLVPAAMGFASGSALFLEYFRNQTSAGRDNDGNSALRLLLGNKKVIGIAAIASAVLHFLFPRVLFL